LQQCSDGNRAVDPGDGPAGRDSRGQMDVMTAGVHRAVCCGPAHPCCLRDRQRVELCPQRDAAGGRIAGADKNDSAFVGYFQAGSSAEGIDDHDCRVGLVA
jgi:hypothetical protein